MRKFLGVLAVSSLALICLNFASAGENDALTIINKSIQATGGEKAIAKHNAVTFTEKGTYYGMGDGLPFTGVFSIQYPGQFRMEIQGVFTMVLNGDKGWMQSMGETKEMPKDQLETQRHDQRANYMTHLIPLKDKAFTLKTLADAKVGKHETRVVHASRKDWPDMKLFFDKTSNLLVKIEYKTKSAELGFKEVTTDTVFSDFKDVAGAKVPHKMVTNHDGKIFIEGEITELNAVGKLDAKVFAQPK